MQDFWPGPLVVGGGVGAVLLANHRSNEGPAAPALALRQEPLPRPPAPPPVPPPAPRGENKTPAPPPAKPAVPVRADRVKPAPPPADPAPPAPKVQDPPKDPPAWYQIREEDLARRRRARKNWRRQLFTAAYERVGRKSPRWDGPARKALQAAEDQTSRSLIDLDEDQEIRYWAAKAVRAGCDDPLIRFLQVYRAFAAKDMDAAVRTRLAREAAEAMRKSAYPPLLRVQAMENAVAQLMVGSPQEPGAREQVKDLLEPCYQLLPEILKDKGPPAREEVSQVCYLLLEASTWVNGSREVGYRKLAAALEKAGAPASFRKLVEGKFFIRYAWAARGNGVADTVTDRGWRLFFNRLRRAEAALKQAWELDRDSPLAASLMITVAMGLNYPREDMEVWFARAMKADPDCYDACAAKLLYLEPKWHGSPKELLDFGRECARTANWDARLPLILARAHYLRAAYTRDPHAYYRDPAVWADLERVYRPFLERHPNSLFDRTWFAWYATNCRQFQEAARQFNRLDERHWVGAFQSEDEYHRVRASYRGLEKGKAPPPAVKKKQEESWPLPRPRGPDGITLAQLNQEPHKYLGRSLEVPALLNRTGIMRAGIPYLEVAGADGARPRSLTFRTTLAISAEWFEMSSARTWWPVFLRCRVGQETERGRIVVLVSSVVVLGREGKERQTIPSPVDPHAPPTLTLVNRAPERYAGRTFTFLATLFGDCVHHGQECELQVTNPRGQKPINLYFSTSRQIADGLARQGMAGQNYPARLTATVGNRVRARTVVTVTRVELLDDQGKVTATIR